MADALAVFAAGALSAFMVAWVTIFPTIGLLWCLGWLS